METLSRHLCYDPLVKYSSFFLMIIFLEYAVLWPNVADTSFLAKLQTFYIIKLYHWLLLVTVIWLKGTSSNYAKT